MLCMVSLSVRVTYGQCPRAGSGGNRATVVIPCGVDIAPVTSTTQDLAIISALHHNYFVTLHRCPAQLPRKESIHGGEIAYSFENQSN